MLNPLHLLFSTLGRMLDLIAPRPRPRPGAPLGAWKPPSSPRAGLQHDAAASRGASR